jgi:hypothetical protein
MPIGPIKRSALISSLRRLGFTGFFSGGKHEFMLKGDLGLTISRLDVSWRPTVPRK